MFQAIAGFYDGRQLQHPELFRTQLAPEKSCSMKMPECVLLKKCSYSTIDVQQITHSQGVRKWGGKSGFNI